MPQSLSKVIIHIIFSTKNRELLIDPSIELELYSYLGGILNSIDCPPIKINGMQDHVHILCLLSRTRTIASLVEDVKKGSSKWIKGKGTKYDFFQWQHGYGSFSVSASKVDAVKKYIEEQKEHHKITSFKEEYLRFLTEYGISYDEKYMWD